MLHFIYFRCHDEMLWCISFDGDTLWYQYSKKTHRQLENIFQNINSNILWEEPDFNHSPKQAIFDLPCASVSKRVLQQKYENEFDLHLYGGRGHLAALTRSHLIGDHPSGLTKEQTTETMDPSPKTKGLRPYPRRWNLVLAGAARLPGWGKGNIFPCEC